MAWSQFDERHGWTCEAVGERVGALRRTKQASRYQARPRRYQLVRRAGSKETPCKVRDQRTILPSPALTVGFFIAVPQTDESNMTSSKLQVQNLSNAGGGRPKGVPNKTTALLKEAIILAAQKTGQDGNGKGGLVGYCRMLAVDEPKAFAALMGRVIPLQVTGPDGADGEPTAIQIRIVDPRA